MSMFEEHLNKLIFNGVAPVTDEKFYLKSNLVNYFKDWQLSKRDYIIIIDGGHGVKLQAVDRFTGTEAIDIYGDKYTVVNNVKLGKKWVLISEKQ